MPLLQGKLWFYRACEKHFSTRITTNMSFNHNDGFNPQIIEPIFQNKKPNQS